MQYPLNADSSAVSAPPPGYVTGDECSQVSGSVPNFGPSRACAGARAELFFPTKGADALHAVEAAKRICAGCPFQAPCRDWAVAQGAGTMGVWGGTTDSERRALRRRHRQLVSA